MEQTTEALDVLMPAVEALDAAYDSLSDTDRAFALTVLDGLAEWATATAERRT